MIKCRMTESKFSGRPSHMTGLPQMVMMLQNWYVTKTFNDNLLNNSLVVTFNVTNIINSFLEISNNVNNMTFYNSWLKTHKKCNTLNMHYQQWRTCRLHTSPQRENVSWHFLVRSEHTIKTETYDPQEQHKSWHTRLTQDFHMTWHMT